MYDSLEEMTADLEVKTKKWHDEYDEKTRIMETRIDELLADLSEKNIVLLIELFDNDDIKTELRKTLKIGYMICVMSVFAQEINEGESCCVLYLGKSINDFMDLLMQLKFLLWRIEFEDDQEALDVLCDFTALNPVSPQFIAAMIRYVDIDKNKMYRILAEYMGKHGLDRHAKYLYNEIVDDVLC